MINTSLDLLYVSLAVGFFLLAVFACMALLYTILILRDVQKATEKAKDTMEKVNDYVMKPIVFMQSVASFVEPIIENVTERMAGEGGKKKKK